MDNETLEGNKLIAEFMGHGGGISDEWNNKPADYNESWMWLMPVVEKISQIEYERYEQDKGLEKYIEIETAFSRTFGMINSRTGNQMVRFNRCQCFEAPTLISATWLAVVDFVKYDNQNK